MSNWFETIVPDDDDDYNIELNRPERDRYYYQNVTDVSYALSSSETMKITGERRVSTFDPVSYTHLRPTRH